MARRSLKPQLNQIRAWAREGRTDAWIAHQLDVTAKDIDAFKREHGLAENGGAEGSGGDSGELDLRAEDDALVAAALEAEPEPEPDQAGDEPTSDGEGGDDSGDQPKRRRGRRGGRRRRGGRKPLEGTFDHGEEGYGLWLDPAVRDDAVYAEHWAGHRPVSVSIEPDRIIIRRAGEEAGEDD